jgi:formiminoglutamase
MDLKLFFSPIDEALASGVASPSSFLKNIRVYSEKMPDFKEAHIALIGIPEERGAAGNTGTARGPDEVRRKLYALKKGHGAYRIADLGNLNPGIDLDETYVRISEVCRMLLENNVLPVLIGGSQDLDYGQYRAYEDLQKLVNLLNIDAFLDLDDSKAAEAARRHINTILLHEPNFLLGYTHLAYQSYLIDPASISILEKLYFQAYRVGHLRSNLREMEPAIRDADMITFDMAAIKSADAPGSAHAQPFGLSGEEACQLCWYAGLNEKLSSIGFYEYNPSLDDARRKTASVMATMIWYFIEGYYHRKKEQDFKSNDFVKYVVSMPSSPETITFFKSKFSEKWWLEVPFPGGRERFARNSIVPCSYADYQTATRGEIPERYIFAVSKLG